MGSTGKRAALIAVAMLASLAGRAAERPVHFVVPPPLAHGVAAMPQIADPADDAERRINAALRQLDATVRKAAAGCEDGDGKPGDWERSVDVPMRGPAYVSFAVTDSMFCGGAHPEAATMAIVYDLRTGRPVDWTHLLPPSLTGKMALADGADGTRMITLASPRLYALYLAGYRFGGPAEDLAACKDAVRTALPDDGPPPMMAWLDAKAAGLAVQFDLPHVVQVCAVPVVIPRATLRQEGALPPLLEAFPPK